MKRLTPIVGLYSWVVSWIGFIRVGRVDDVELRNTCSKEVLPTKGLPQRRSFILLDFVRVTHIEIE